MTERHPKASFYKDTLRCIEAQWTSERKIRRRLEVLGWHPKPRDLRRMLHLLEKHDKIQTRSVSGKGRAQNQHSARLA